MHSGRGAGRGVGGGGQAERSVAHKFKLIKDIDRSALAGGIFSSEFSRTKSPGWLVVCSGHPRRGRRLICDGNVGRLISGKSGTKERTSVRFFLVVLLLAEG